MRKIISRFAGAGTAVLTTLLAGATKVAAQYSYTYDTTDDAASAGILGLSMICNVIICIFSVATFAFTVWMLIDCLKRDEKVLPGKIKWALVIWFLAPVGGILYFFMRKRKM